MKKPTIKSEKSSLASLFRFIRLRPLLGAVIFMLVLMLGARVFDMAGQLAKGRTPPGIAPVMAEDAKPQEMDAQAKKEEPKKEDAKKEELKKEEPKKEEPKVDPATDGKSTESKPPEAKPADISAPAPTDKKPDAPAAADAHAEGTASAPDVADPSLDVPDNYTEAEVAILRKLSDRRKELEKRSREMDEREALLKVSEQRVDKKIADLKDLRAQIEKIVGVATDDQKKQADSLVKIYETMKPKEAAKIFENLDLPVLINVVRRMKEARVSPILGAMDPVKAKELTAALMEKKDLPEIPK